jgi:hypothetical protein
MQKDPKKRLGANGIKEIKSHPWFDPIDFGLLEAGYEPPPFVPNVGGCDWWYCALMGLSCVLFVCCVRARV